MNNIFRAFIIGIATMFVVASLHAGVKVSSPEPEVSAADTATNATAPQASSSETDGKRVVFRTTDSKYVTANTGGALDLSGVKVGSKQRFTLIDLNGGELADGDQVKILYTPNTGGVPDPTKASYWREKDGGVKRGKEGATFKLKKVEGKFAFETAAGKFITGAVTEGALGLSDKKEAALLVEVVDAQASVKAGKKPAAE